MFTGMPAVFTRMLQGEQLSQAYASGDLFAMPSKSKTLGQVVLDPIASGVPAVLGSMAQVREVLMLSALRLRSTPISYPHRLMHICLRCHAMNYGSKSMFPCGRVALMERKVRPLPRNLEVAPGQIAQLSEKNLEVLFLQVNYEKHKSMCYSLHVHVLPFLRFYRGAQGRVSSFSCTNATIKKFKDVLAKHGRDRCSLSPAKGLEESELWRQLQTGPELHLPSETRPCPNRRCQPEGSCCT